MTDKPKVLITVQGGLIQFITSESDLEVTVYDADLGEVGEQPEEALYGYSLDAVGADEVAKALGCAEMEMQSAYCEHCQHEDECEDSVRECDKFRPRGWRTDGVVVGSVGCCVVCNEADEVLDEDGVCDQCKVERVEV